MPKKVTDTYGFPIDMTRPVVVANGEPHTEYSITHNIAGKWVNIPTIWDGVMLNPDDPEQFGKILQHYYKNKKEGWSFPTFDSLDAAEKAAQERSRQLGIIRKKDIEAALKSAGVK